MEIKMKRILISFLMLSIFDLSFASAIKEVSAAGNMQPIKTVFQLADSGDNDKSTGTDSSDGDSSDSDSSDSDSSDSDSSDSDSSDSDSSGSDSSEQ
jgi:hypothetical protein